MTVGPGFWGTNVSFKGGRTVHPRLDSGLDYLSLGLKEQQSLLLGLTVQVKLSLGLNVSGLNV